jgi:hypothetical protein
VPRQLATLVTTQVSHQRRAGTRGTRFNQVYGPTYSELAKYLVDKYGIRKPYIHALLYDVFRYIEMEVLSGAKGAFTVPRFGRFLRREVTHGDGEGGRATTDVVMRFTRANVKRGGSYIDFEDEEWVDE